MPEPRSEFFTNTLEQWGDRTALVAEDGQAVSYADLAARADRFGASLKAASTRQRGLLVLEMTNTVAAVTAYLGALRAKWPVILVAEGKATFDADLVKRFSPDVICKADGTLVAGPGSAEALHEDLAILLSTSGSTGSTKLVRLSHTNIHENARSIAEYLGLTPDRVAITTLPMHYTYGLSVLHSFLLAGGTVALTDLSVIDPTFRAFLDRVGATDLAGVPYTYELLERSGFPDNLPATLRAMTQAGGRLAPEIVERYGLLASDKGFEFFVMYGQTEATARMAWLPPKQTLAHPDCIGIAIPGGRFELRAEDGAIISTAGVAGELVYHGPNVMMGYGLTRADLGNGPELPELATGDIAERLDNGFYRIVGRMSRFAKIAGLRISFDEVERLLRAGGFEGIATGNDSVVLLALRSGDIRAARDLIVEKCGIPAASVFAFALADLPVLASGKVDMVTLRETGLALLASEQGKAGRTRTIAGIFSRAMNRAHLPEEESFASLGGDSLAYVTASIGVEELLGTTPEGWETMPIRQLQALADARSAAGHEAPAGGRKLTIGSDVPLRLLAISLIFLGHGYPEKTEMLRGGANVLFALAGYSMASIHLPMLLEGRVKPFLRGIFMRLVVPYLLIVSLLLPITASTAKSLSWFTLTSTIFLTGEQRGLFYSFWFIESLIHAMLITCGLFLIAPFRAMVRRQPFMMMLVLVACSYALALIGRQYWPNGTGEGNISVDGWLYVFFIGWAIHFAKDLWQKLALIAVTAALALQEYGVDMGRPYWLTAAVVFMLFIPTLRLGTRLCKFLIHLTGATYFMYIFHPLVGHILREVLHLKSIRLAYIAALYFGSVFVGLLMSDLWQRFLLAIQKARMPR